MAIRIEVPSGEDALSEFVLFQDRVYRDRSARWTAFLPMELPVLTGESPFRIDRAVRPFWAVDGGEVVARALAVVDGRYLRHWGERLGHVAMFEALPGAAEATRLVMDAACEWLRGEGMEAARAGYGMLEFPYVIDAYDALPPPFVRHNPPSYHAFLKGAGFETEQGWVDYRIRVTPALEDRWRRAVEAGRRAGFRLLPLREVPEAGRYELFTRVWTETFAAHWGYTPFVEEEVSMIFASLEPTGSLDLSLLAFEGDEPAGVLWIIPDVSVTAALAPGRVLRPEERLNLLGIGVRERARRRGLNFAMAGHAYLELARRGAEYLSYTLVLDHNWPSRRTAEKLGASVCANYVVYRRDLRR